MSPNQHSYDSSGYQQVEAEAAMGSTAVLKDEEHTQPAIPAAYTLPDELWVIILELTYLHHFPDCHTEQHHTADFVVPFSLVSQRFRRLALGLPSLWSCVHITSPDFDALQLPRRQSILREQLERSQDRPLTVLFSFLREMNDFDELAHWCNWDLFKERPEYWDAQLSFVQTLWHAYRWKRLAVFARHTELVRMLFEDTFTRHDVPMMQLEEYEVFVDDITPEPTQKVCVLDIGTLHAPKLKTLRCRGVRLIYSTPAVQTFRLTELVFAHCPTIMAHRTLAYGVD